MESSRRLFSLFCLVAAACLTSPTGSNAEDGVATLDRSVLTSLDDTSAEPWRTLRPPCHPVPAAASVAACACQPDAPWSLPQPCLFQQTGIKLGGWLQQGITLNSVQLQ